MPKLLLDSSPESEADDDSNLKINKDYAKSYDNWRGKEELQKLKDKYGNVTYDESIVDSEDSSSEYEDDIGEEITPTVEHEFLRTLSALKDKRPELYANTGAFFPEHPETLPNESKVSARKVAVKDEPMSIRDYERKVVLEKEGRFVDEDENILPSAATTTLPYVQQQQQLKQEFHKAWAAVSDQDTDVLTERMKTKEETADEERDYVKWLQGQTAVLNNPKEQEDLRALHDYWTDPALDDGEAFLRDYILNRRYRDNTDDDRLPTYEEIVNSANAEWAVEEDELQREEQFERKYNFRFEEPDPEFIKSYPRSVSDTLRQKDDKRSKERQAHRERKEMEKQKRREEVKHLKNLKRKEIEDKLAKLKQVTGNAQLPFSVADLEEDFNADEYDRRMQEIFTEQYDADQDEQKPVFSDSESDHDWDNWNAVAQPGTSDSHADVGEPCVLQDEIAEGQDKVREFGSKKESALGRALRHKKPMFDPSERSFDQYYDEYYQLDCEDFVGDQPCRFRYREVQSNDFGLSVEDILQADDKELNSWVSLRKTVQYRPESEEIYDVNAYKQKAADVSLKAKKLPGLLAKQSSEAVAADVRAHVRKKKRHKKSRTPAADDEQQVEGQTTAVDQKEDNGLQNHSQQERTSDKRKHGSYHSKTRSYPSGKLKRKKIDEVDSYSQLQGVSDARLEAYGVNPKKFRDKIKYSKRFNK